MGQNSFIVHYHLLDKGIGHRYIKPEPRLTAR